MGKIVVITGNMCAGKNTLRKQLQKEGFEYILPTTVRAPRFDEQQDIDYNFVPGSVFERLVNSGSFIAVSREVDDEDRVIRYGWWKMDFDPNQPAPSNNVRLAIMPIEVLFGLLETQPKTVAGIISLRCNPITSIYRQTKRANCTLDPDVMRSLGVEFAKWRMFYDDLSAIAQQKKIPILTYWTDLREEPITTDEVIADLMKAKIMQGGKR